MEFKLNTVLAKLIKNNSLTVTKLSKETCVNVQTLHNWLAGQKPRNIVQVKLVADFFNISIEYLCFGEISHKFQYDRKEEIFEVRIKRIGP